MALGLKARHGFTRLGGSLAAIAGGVASMWLLAIARQRALTHLRDDARRRTHEGRSLDSVAAGWAARSVEGDDAGFARHERELRALEECIKSLAPASAGILSEFYFRGRSALEIARTTGKRDTAVWMTLSRIRQALREAASSALPPEEVRQLVEEELARVNGQRRPKEKR